MGGGSTSICGWWAVGCRLWDTGCVCVWWWCAAMQCEWWAAGMERAGRACVYVCVPPHPSSNTPPPPHCINIPAITCMCLAPTHPPPPPPPPLPPAPPRPPSPPLRPSPPPRRGGPARARPGRRAGAAAAHAGPGAVPGAAALGGRDAGDEPVVACALPTISARLHKCGGGVRWSTHAEGSVRGVFLGSGKRQAARCWERSVGAPVGAPVWAQGRRRVACSRRA